MHFFCSEVASTLNSFGLKPTGDLTMTEAIQKEVKRLCNRDNIANAIFNQDMKDKYAENHRKYLQVEEESTNTKVSVSLHVLLLLETLNLRQQQTRREN